MTRIVCISDTHGYHHNLSLPSGDILIHAGDFTYMARDRQQVEDFAEWVGRQPFQHVIIVAGNHELIFDPEHGGKTYWGGVGPEALSLGHLYLQQTWSRMKVSHCHYLQNSGVEIGGLSIYGAPEQPAFCEMAFNVYSSEHLWRTWTKIPQGVDILVTHSPPMGILDKVIDKNGRILREDLGCRHLMDKVKNLSKLKLHVFGHIHESYGIQSIDGVTYLNACICDDYHKPKNQPFIVDLDIKI